MKTRRLNPDMIVSFEIHKEHASERFSIRPERIVSKFFGLVAAHQDRAVMDRDYWEKGTTEYQYPWEFLKEHSDRYEIVGNEIICKAEVKIMFVDGQTAKFYFKTFADAITWVKSLPLINKLDNWIQAGQSHQK